MLGNRKRTAAGNLWGVDREKVNKMKSNKRGLLVAGMKVGCSPCKLTSWTLMARQRRKALRTALLYYAEGKMLTAFHQFCTFTISANKSLVWLNIP